MPGTFRIGKIAGIDIDIHVSWIIILVLLTVSLATGWFPQLYRGWSTATYWVIAFLSSLLLFVSVLLHELAHSLVARRRGLPVKSITLFIFGGVSNIEREPPSPGIEFQMAFVGPLISIVIGVICFLLQVPLRGSNSPLEGILFYLAVTNVLLGVFNLIPGFPLDGGRVLHSIVWRLTGNLRQATRVSALTGQVIAYLFILLGIWLFFVGDLLDGIWLGFIGWFLLSAARLANAQGMLTSVLRGVRVGEVMNPKPATVPADISLQQLVDAYFLPDGLRYALVMQADQLVGLMTLSDIRHIPRDQWGQVPVSTAMIPLARLHIVTPQQSLSDVLPLLAGRDVNQLPVVENGAPVGILSRDAVVQYLEVQRSLGAENAQSDAHNQLRRAAQRTTGEGGYLMKRWNHALLLLALGVPGLVGSLTALYPGETDHWLLLLTVGAMIMSGPGMFLAGVISLLGTRRFLRQAASAKGRVSDIYEVILTGVICAKLT